MFAHERHEAILLALEAGKPLTVPQLQRVLRVSGPTIRRDLAFLSDTGKVIRTHGAVVHPDHIDAELSFARKTRAALSAKIRLAEAAVRLVRPGQSVFVDAGSTAFEAGKRMLQVANLTVITNSIPLLSERPAASVRLIALGGEVRSLSLALVGGEAADWIRKLRLDAAFLGTSGLDLTEGPTTTEFSEAGVKSAVIAKAKRTVVLADASKWGRPAPICYARWAQVHDLITDQDRSQAGGLAAAGTKIHWVKP